MEHGVKLSKAEEAVATVMLNLEITKDEHTQACNSEKKQQNGTKEKAHTRSSLEAAKSTYEKGTQAVDAVKIAIWMAGANAFKLYGNLLSHGSRQPWEKMGHAKMAKCQWGDIYRQSW
jgi:hypothetical protein